MERNFKELPVNKQFMRWLVKPETWIINPISMDNAVPHPHVVEGDEYVAIMDTTDCELELRKYVEENFHGKKYCVFSTHSHGDHTANNYMFADCPIYMTEQAYKEVQMYKENNMNGWYRGDYEVTIVKPGDKIDLGNRVIECLDFCGCHSESSIAYLDTKYGVLFTGDEFEGGQVLTGGRGRSCVEQYHENLVSLKKQIAGRATCICPPHNGSPMDPQALDNMIENCERVMQGIPGMEDIRSMTFIMNPHGWATSAHFGNDFLRSEWKGTSLVYNRNVIFKKDLRN